MGKKCLNFLQDLKFCLFKTRNQYNFYYVIYKLLFRKLGFNLNNFSKRRSAYESNCVFGVLFLCKIIRPMSEYIRYLRTIKIDSWNSNTNSLLSYEFHLQITFFRLQVKKRKLADSRDSLLDNDSSQISFHKENVRQNSFIDIKWNLIWHSSEIQGANIAQILFYFRSSGIKFLNQKLPFFIWNFFNLEFIELFSTIILCLKKWKRDRIRERNGANPTESVRFIINFSRISIISMSLCVYFALWNTFFATLASILERA